VVNGHVPVILLYREKKTKREGGGIVAVSADERRGGRTQIRRQQEICEPLPYFFFKDCRPYTVKKRLAIFPSPAGTSLTKLSLAGRVALLLPFVKYIFGIWE
jgi:hypothetical protein